MTLSGSEYKDKIQGSLVLYSWHLCIYHLLVQAKILQKIEKHIEYFSCRGKFVICGDLNARVGGQK